MRRQKGFNKHIRIYFLSMCSRFLTIVSDGQGGSFFNFFLWFSSNTFFKSCVCQRKKLKLKIAEKLPAAPPVKRNCQNTILKWVKYVKHSKFISYDFSKKENSPVLRGFRIKRGQKIVVIQVTRETKTIFLNFCLFLHSVIILSRINIK